MLVLQHSVTSTQQSARMAVTDLSSSFGATNNRLLCFECIMAACSAAMETAQLLRVSSQLVAGCLSCRESCAHVRAVSLVDDYTDKQPTTISFICAGLVRTPGDRSGRLRLTLMLQRTSGP